MDLESIIWIAIFLIYIASIVLKRVRRAAKTKRTPAVTGLDPDQTASPMADIDTGKRPPEKRRSDWKQRLTGLQGQLQSRLGDFVNQLQQELEAAKKKDQSKETGWEKLLSAKDRKADLVAIKKAKTVVSMAADRKGTKAGVIKGAAAKTEVPISRKGSAPGRLQPVKSASSSKPKPSAPKIVAGGKEPAKAGTDRTAGALTFPCEI